MRHRRGGGPEGPMLFWSLCFSLPLPFVCLINSPVLPYRYINRPHFANALRMNMIFRHDIQEFDNFP